MTVAELQQPIDHHTAAVTLPEPACAASGSSSALRGAPRVLAVGVSSVLLLFVLGVFALGLPLALSNLNKGSVGVFLGANAAGETVLTPEPDGAAARAGVREGDILLAVDGIALVPWAPSGTARRLLAGPPGAAISLDVRSVDGTVRRVDFSRDPFALEPYGVSALLYAHFMTVLSALFVVAYCIPAIIIFVRKSDDWLAMLVSVTMIAIAFVNSPAYASSLLAPAWLTPAVALVYNVGVLLVLCLFPSGRFAPRWTRVYFLLGLGWILLKTAPLRELTALHSAPWWNSVFYLCDVSIFGAGIVAQVLRYRRDSSPAERLQTKWIVYGMAVAFLAQYSYWITLNLVPELASLRVAGLAFRAVGGTLYQLAMLVVPFTFLHAVLKRHLYSIDLIISRTLIYVPLSAILAGVLAATTTLLQRAFIALTGQKSDLAAVLASLAVAVLITPIRDRLQAAVTKRFKGTPPAIAKLNALEEQVQSRMAPVQRERAIRRTLEEAVSALGAEGGAAYDSAPEMTQQIHSIGAWTGQPLVTVPLEVMGKPIGSIALGARRGRRDYNEAERTALRRVADAVARAIEEDRQLLGA